jgi:hypothetical protein
MSVTSQNCNQCVLSVELITTFVELEHIGFRSALNGYKILWGILYLEQKIYLQ